MKRFKDYYSIEFTFKFENSLYNIQNLRKKTNIYAFYFVVKIKVNLLQFYRELSSSVNHSTPAVLINYFAEYLTDRIWNNEAVFHRCCYSLFNDLTTF